MNQASGTVTISSSYTPWGDTLEYQGQGNFAFGYFGGLMDAATGLLYVGNGQYYDPSTGRFLTRHAKPDNTNPHVPWNPSRIYINFDVGGIGDEPTCRRSNFETIEK
jgi:RHS repeat-associated protein